MNIITKWIEALRSGKYEQAQSALKEGNAYCCLGVLVDIYPGFSFEDHEGYEEIRNPQGHYTNELEYEPAPIAEALGLNTEPPEWLLKRVGESMGNVKQVDFALAGLNDGKGLNFIQIADVVERLYNEGAIHDPVETT